MDPATAPARPAGARRPGGGLALNYLETLVAADGRCPGRGRLARARTSSATARSRRSGRPGGEWTPAAPLSAVTRDAFSPELLVAPDGTLRAAWSELRPRVGGDLFRAARLSPTPSPDTTPPAIDTRLPARTKLTRNGRVSFRIPVTCSEACDARVRVIARDGHESVADVRELPAGRTTTFRLGPEEGFAHELLQSRRNRRPRLDVLVTDRAGNVARRSRTVVVPVRRRGVLGLRVSLGHDFGMSSRAGNRAVARLVNRLITRLARNEITSYDQLHGAYLRGIERISHHHDEVLRCAVVDKILRALGSRSRASATTPPPWTPPRPAKRRSGSGRAKRSAAANANARGSSLPSSPRSSSRSRGAHPSALADQLAQAPAVGRIQVAVVADGRAAPSARRRAA